MTSSPKQLGPGGPDDPIATPEQFPVSPPREVETDARVYDLHGKVSKLEQQVQRLEDDRVEQKAAMRSLQKTLGTHQKLLWTAGGVLLLVGLFTAGFGAKIWDTWMEVHDLLKRQSPVTTPAKP